MPRLPVRKSLALIILIWTLTNIAVSLYSRWMRAFSGILLPRNPLSVPLAELLPRLQTGDLLICTADKPGEKYSFRTNFATYWGSSPWTHIGMVVRKDNNQLLLWHSVPNKGCCLQDLPHFLRETHDRFWFRCLEPLPSTDPETVLANELSLAKGLHFIERHLGSPYDLSLGGLIVSLTGGGMSLVPGKVGAIRPLTCSALIAGTLLAMNYIEPSNGISMIFNAHPRDFVATFPCNEERSFRFKRAYKVETLAVPSSKREPLVSGDNGDEGGIVQSNFRPDVPRAFRRLPKGKRMPPTK